MTSMRRLWVVVALVLTGCPEDGGGSAGLDGSGPADGALDATARDAAARDAAADGGAHDVGSPDRGARDAEPDARPLDAASADAAVADAGSEPDMAGAGGIASCQAACDRYVDCQQLDQAFDDEADCLRTCGRLEAAGQTAGWWDCLEAQACDRLQRCPIPVPPPSACDAVCDRADVCGLVGCAGACDAAEQVFERCAGALEGPCDVDGFLACVGRDALAGCAAECAETVRCNLVRPEACLLACVAGQADPDPLFSLRARQQESCVGDAGGDCAAIDRCLHGPGDAPPADPALFCQLYRACGFDAVIPCELALAQFDPDGLMVPCGVDLMQRGCPADPFEILRTCQGANPDAAERAAQCERLCDAHVACGGPEGGDRDACVTSCRGAGDPVIADRVAAALPCAAEDRCPAFEACLFEVGPAADCRAWCDALDVCGLAEAECPDACEAVWARDRQAAARACVASAVGCVAVGACLPAPGPPCEAYCDRAVACGLEGADGHCEDRCDDAHFQSPAFAGVLDACVISAPTCGPDAPHRHTAAACAERPDDGLACLGYCRQKVECAGGSVEALGACLTACRGGFEGDDAVALRLARDCLEAQPRQAACGALAACVPAV
ncbi:MAG: hypothetical protein R3F43_32520, partial [bacterium]